ncbi:MAG: hypothetical protein RIS83_2465 [Pseudomonadota bacterium]|jgi:hypothetical protein
MAMLHIPGQAGRSFAAILFATAGLSALAPAPLGAQPADPVANAEARPSSPASDALTQRNVPAEATAENGVIAQERAFVAGRRAAWERIQGTVDTTRRPSDAELDRMVRSIVIEQEITGPQRYSGRLTIQFDAEAVRSFAEGGEIRQSVAGRAAQQEAASVAPPTPILTSLEAVARYTSLQEWVEIRRRLTAAGAKLDVVGISTDRARLRLGLRVPVGLAPEDFSRHGLRLAPGTGAVNDQWRLGLAGRS